MAPGVLWGYHGYALYVVWVTLLNPIGSLVFTWLFYTKKWPFRHILSHSPIDTSSPISHLPAMPDTPRTLSRLSFNPPDTREERPICSDGVIPCMCGSMPAGVEYVSDILGSDGKPDPMHACVIIKCPKCFRMVMTQTVDHAVACWFSVA